MKKIRYLSIILGATLLTIIGLSVDKEQKPKTEIKREYIAWVEKCLKDFQSIQVGMTRGEIEEKFPLDGGLQGVSPVIFTHPECPYFKIDVSFEFQRDKNDQNRAIWSPDDKVIKTSKPYIEMPYSD